MRILKSLIVLLYIVVVMAVVFPNKKDNAPLKVIKVERLSMFNDIE